MCKLAFSKTKDGSAYSRILGMLKHQENVVAGHSTGIAWHDSKGVHLRKAVGKVINFKAEFTDEPKTDIAVGHSRFATVGLVNKQNAHPIPLYYKGKRIGYGVHNGTWPDYKSYLHYRNRNRVNETDTALMFDIYQKLLEKIGDGHRNRRTALATLHSIVDSSKMINTNFILLFDDGQVLFEGTKLTYKDGDEVRVGVMTFGLPNSADVDKVYEVKDFRVLKYLKEEIRNHGIVRKEKKVKYGKVKKQESRLLPPAQTTLHQHKRIPTHKKIDKKYWTFVMGNFGSQDKAQIYGEILKKKRGLQYRTVQLSNKMWAVYVHKPKHKEGFFERIEHSIEDKLRKGRGRT